MSQSPLSRAIRELERELGVVLFVRTTRRVELTPAGSALLVRARRALAEVDLAVDDARRWAQPGHGVAGIGHGPFSRPFAARIARELAARRPEPTVRLEEDVSPELLRRVAAHELAMAAVFETPGAARRHGVRIDTLRDEPLLAALPATHRYADADASRSATSPRNAVLLPREPTGRAFNVWLRAGQRRGVRARADVRDAERSWDRRMLPVADGEAVSAFVGDWAQEASPGVVAVPLDPPVTFPLDLASCRSPRGGTEMVVQAALGLRDGEGWLTRRPARTELPSD
jgi:DNA-binding transcriptional LysR family regulator